MNKIRFCIGLNKNLLSAIKKVAKERECSQAEVIRTALQLHLKDYLDQKEK